MKKIKTLFYLLTFFAIFSCSDTKVIENLPADTEDAEPVPGYFQKNVLIEDYTGTWCGNCTRVAYAIDQVHLHTDKVVTVAIHNGNDPYHFENFMPLKDLIMPDSPALELPQSRLNRTITWLSPEPSNIQQAKGLTGNNSGLGLAISSSISNGMVNVEVNMKFVQNYSGLKLVVYLLEDHLIRNQVNYTSYYGNVNPVPNYEHNHVLRLNLTDLLGDPITENTTAGQQITKSFSIPVPSNISNPDNISFAAFIVQADNLSLNARHADLNENQTYQQNQ